MTTTTPTAELVELLSATAIYHGIDLDDPATAFGAAAAELRFPGYLASNDKAPPDEYATHNMVIRALGVAAKRGGLDVPDAARCEGGRCARLRIPGFPSCHWHGASATPDDEILAVMTTEIGA